MRTTRDTGWLIDDVTPFKNSAMQGTASDSADDGSDTSYSYSNDLAVRVGYQGTGFPACPEVGDAADVDDAGRAPRVTATMVEGITTGMTYGGRIRSRGRVDGGNPAGGEQRRLDLGERKL